MSGAYQHCLAGWMSASSLPTPSYQKLVLLGLLVFGAGGTVSVGDPCPQGSFPCDGGNLTDGECLQQRFWCDGRATCSNGADEWNIYCDDQSGFFRQFMMLYGNRTMSAAKNSAAKISAAKISAAKISAAKTSAAKTSADKTSADCVLLYYPAECVCYEETRLRCAGANIYQMPVDMPANVTKLLLTNTSVSTLPPRYFTNFTHLTSLVMENNLISEIPVGSFDGLEQLRYLFILGNRIQQLKKGTFSHMAKLRWLLLKGNRLSFLDSDVFEGLESLQILKLDSNRLRLNDGTLYLPQSLRFLYLDNNRIEEVTSKTFSANKLYTLKLNQNKICYLSEDAFHGMRSLVDLRLDENKITQLPARMFKYPNKIETLHIGNNPYDALPPNIFDHLQDLTSLNMSNIEITNIDERLFQHLNKLQHGYFKKFYYCRFVPQARDCFPKGDGISTTSNLLDRTMLRAFVWIVAVVTCAGNTMVIILRFVLKDEHSIHSLFIKNLGAADFTMGIYLFVIGCHDILFRDEYNKYTLSWTNSWGCQATGFLAMMSCEVSVLILAFMSVERCITITSPLKARPLTRRRATLCLSIIWATGMLLAMVPIVSSDLLGNFYGINGVCFPLHIHDPFMLGWQYSAFVFIVVNLVAMSVIGVSYCLMYCSISRTQQGVTVPSAHDTGVAKRFFLIVLTDALCWVPIICIKLLALAQITISTSLYAWLAVFILPINSALNPILYSFTTAVFRKKIAELYRHFQKRHIAASFMTTSSRMRSRGSSCSASGFTAYTSGSSKDVTMISDRKESHSDLITQQSKPLMAITEDPITTATPNMADVHM